MRALAKVTRRFFGRKLSVRYRLLAIALVPMLVILPVFLATAAYTWNGTLSNMLVAKVNNDLTIARQYLTKLIDDAQGTLTAICDSARMRSLLENNTNSPRNLDILLRATPRADQFDFLYIVDDAGQILAKTNDYTSSVARRDWPVVRAALEGQARTSIDIFDASELAALSPDLVRRAQVKLVAVEGAEIPRREKEVRGLVIQSASPLALPDGRRAALVGGRLLNNNLDFINTINDLVYHGAGLPSRSRGTATLFLDDVRVSTNVNLFPGQRAIGTVVSAEVRAAVLDQGKTWLGRAFVVNDWYVSAYQPLLDSYGRRVGMLYVGFLEQPFTDVRRDIIYGMALAFAGATIATVPLFLRWASGIFKPLERMTGTIARVDAGDLDARTVPVDTGSEVGQVAHHLDRLLDRLRERDAEIRQWNRELNHRVEERTLRLQHANQRLESATKQLVMSEKLATIGEITAGVAHEINNPIAVIQGNLEVIRDALAGNAEAGNSNST